LSTSLGSAKASLRVLAFADYYLPGFRAGGPIRALANLVDALRGDVEFRIVTRAHDLGGPRYENIDDAGWTYVRGARVLYLNNLQSIVTRVSKLLQQEQVDIIYLNSFFSPFSRAAMLTLLRPGEHGFPIIIAPRGEFSREALRLKRLRKRAYLWLMKALLTRATIFWQASSLHEAEDIRGVFGKAGRRHPIVVTEEIATLPSEVPIARQKKTRGKLRIAFLSRISPMKNLDGALGILSDLTGDVTFNIYGPVEDERYWEECSRRMRDLPENIEVAVHGSVQHDEVSKLLAANDLFFLPSWGENYGHVIVEALSAGCPVLISQNTRWRGLKEKGVGWDINLSGREEFRRALRSMVEMGEAEHQAMRDRARAYANMLVHDPTVVERNREMFRLAARQASSKAQP
jgi:glycosyltransferase involved in cell wall biosynthesis